ncbi:MAG: hypothetical protein OEO77_04060 [Acidimicrobiia bacterium]|nr:hypothetical protein [Acidimicrobiia bacterium]
MKPRLGAPVTAAATLIFLRVVLGVTMWQPGWSALTWDDFSRVSLAQGWAAMPYLASDLVWLPGQTWIAGATYLVFGDQFLSSPMALMAILNTTALVLAALLTAWSAWMLFGSRLGTLIALAAVLFAPWGFFTSLSGLNEPLYYLAVAGAVCGFSRWMTTDRIVPLIGGTAAIVLACTLRYEGWWLAAGWAAGVIWRKTTTSSTGLIRSTLAVSPIVAVPFLVPLGWFVFNYQRVGDPLFFARESARYFLSAYGNDLFDSIPERLTYYPFAAIRSAPLLILMVIGLLVALRSDQRVRHLALIPALAFVPFYGTSLLSPAVGAFNERFMFAFVLALVPVLGYLPAALRAAVNPRYLRVTGAGLAVLALGVSGFRTLDRPVEWTHAPDLLALTEVLGEAGTGDDPLTIVLGDGLTIESIPLTIQNGNRTRFYTAAGLGLNDPDQLPSDADLWIERLPGPIADAGEPADAAIGRYHLWWDGQSRIEPGADESDGWTYTSETGATTTPTSSVYVPLEFFSDDPPPGSRAALSRHIPRGSSPAEGSIRLRWLYGHGFNAGRMTVEVVVDGLRVWSTDISASSRWTDVTFTIPAGTDTSTLEVAVVAQPGIESGWAWGRASTVLVDEVSFATP